MNITTWADIMDRVPERVRGFFPPTAVMRHVGTCVFDTSRREVYVKRSGVEVVSVEHPATEYMWGTRRLVVRNDWKDAAPVPRGKPNAGEHVAPDLWFVDNLLVVKAHAEETTMEENKAARARQMADASLTWRDMGGCFTRYTGDMRVCVNPRDGVWHLADKGCAPLAFNNAAKKARLTTFRVFQNPDDPGVFCVLPVDGETPRVIGRPHDHR